MGLVFIKICNIFENGCGLPIGDLPYPPAPLKGEFGSAGSNCSSIIVSWVELAPTSSPFQGFRGWCLLQEKVTEELQESDRKR
jgi:hypothetical protein